MRSQEFVFTGFLVLLGALSSLAYGDQAAYSFSAAGQTSLAQGFQVTIPARAPFVGLESSLRICGDMDRPTSVSLHGPETPIALWIKEDGDKCVVSSLVTFDQPGILVLGVEFDASGDRGTIQIPVAAESSYLASELFQTLKRDDGTSWTLTWPANPVTNRTKTAVVCLPESASVTEFKPWMVAHGHGTSPTSISQRSDRCYQVERINFVMVGGWEMLLKTSVGEDLRVMVDVVRAP